MVGGLGQGRRNALCPDHGEPAFCAPTQSAGSLFSITARIPVSSFGEAVTYTNWDEGEDNNCTPPVYGEDYAVLNWDTGTGQWNDWDHQRPDYSYINGIYENPVPVPGAVLLGMLGLSVAGVKLRKRS